MELREISPAENMSSDEFLQFAHPEQIKIVNIIRQQKLNGERTSPSELLIDDSKILNEEFRKALIDKVASLVDENLFGRSEMCQQFAMLLSLSLNHLGIYSKVVLGKATYSNGFSWIHCWVCTKEEIIDANADSMLENPAIPSDLAPKPFWGSKANLPKDRKFKPKPNAKVPKDTDVNNIWWPELKIWISQYNK
ncbi:hypothetical protein [Neptuniibacter marinus]|uniref:hypothetical protein n=1 Tax=Neptuniibacter marinus TaxID=1806670 RepID=UPI0008302967|nr:hypothetical protein [Neptuniibacter marinus]